MGPSAISIKKHVCAPHLFVLTDDFCNKTQTFWYFSNSWVMTFCFAFGLAAVSRGKCSLQLLLAVLVCLWDELKNRMSLTDVPCTKIKSRPTRCYMEPTGWSGSLRHILWDTTIRHISGQKMSSSCLLFYLIVSVMLLFKKKEKHLL